MGKLSGFILLLAVAAAGTEAYFWIEALDQRVGQLEQSCQNSQPPLATDSAAALAIQGADVRRLNEALLELRSRFGALATQRDQQTNRIPAMATDYAEPIQPFTLEPELKPEHLRATVQ